jgi:hypothetical protein
MEQITNNIALCLADRFTAIAHMLRKTLGAPDYARFDLSLKWAIWHRLSRLSLRFRALALNPRQIRRRKHRAKSASTPNRSELPRQQGWLLQTFPGHHIPYVRGHLIRFLEDPDIISLHTENPRVGRVLRPICHMLAIPLPDYLKLERKPRPKPEPKPARQREKKPEPTLYEYFLQKYPAPPPRPTLPGHIYAPTASPKINFAR